MLRSAFFLRLTVKILSFLRLTIKFLAVLRLTVNPIETLFRTPEETLALVFDILHNTLHYLRLSH